MQLPNYPITIIPDTEPDAIPALWNDRYEEIDENFNSIETALTSVEAIITTGMSGSDTAEVLQSDWNSRGNMMYAERWTSLWTLLDPISLTVVTAVASSDTIDVDTTVGLVEGQYYVISSTSGASEIIKVETVVSLTRFTATANLVNTFVAGSKISKTTFTVTLGSAVTHNQNCYLFGPLYSGNSDAEKKLIIQRTQNSASINVYYYDDANSLAFTSCSVNKTTVIETGWVEVEYIVPTRGNTSFKIQCIDSSTLNPVTIKAIYFFEEDLFKTIFTNTKYYVSTTGNDTTGSGTALAPWRTVTQAMTSLQSFWIASGATITIEMGDGLHEYTELIDLGHPCGSRIVVTGKTVNTLNISQLLSCTAGATSGDSTYYSAVFSIGSGTSLVAIGDYVIIDSATSPTTYSGYMGCHKVTAVSSANSTFTVEVFHTTTTQPATGLCTMSAKVLKTVVYFPSIETGFLLKDGFAFKAIRNMAIVGTVPGYPPATVGAGGIAVWEGSQLQIGGSLGISGWYQGLSCRDLSAIVFENSTICAVNLGYYGVLLSGSCYMGINYGKFIASGCVYGISSVVNANFHANKNSTVFLIGCSLYGASAASAGFIYLAPTHVIAEGCAVTGGFVFIASKGGFLTLLNAHTLIGTNGTLASPAVNTSGNEQGYIDTP